MADNADVVVIGAGALGLSAAMHCALRGRSVVVVERKTAGSPAIGETQADWICDGHPSAPLAPFRPDRFGAVGDDQLVRNGAWQYTRYYEPDP
jgi:glycine/D-amino acid oxidase-like deaminating enzyme